jgi:hypothetical protein
MTIPVTSNSVDLSGLHPRFKSRLESFFDDPRIKGRVAVSSACRTYAQQSKLYKKYKEGRGNLAANPDREFGPKDRDGNWMWRGSWHQVQPDGWGYAVDFHRLKFDLKTWEINNIAKEYGMHPTVSGEWWHHQPRYTNEWFDAPILIETKADKDEPEIDWAKVFEYIAQLKKDVSSNPIRHKERSDRVKVLQRRLGYLGHDAGVPDGIFGRKTKKAVKKFQKNRGLHPDGIVGPITWSRLWV